MPRGFLSVRIDDSNPLHHLWRNQGGSAGGLFWVHFTLHFDGKKRRIRRSLKTADVQVAIARRNSLFLKLQTEGEEVPDRAPRRRRRRAADEESSMLATVL